jgi:hypothetical protein
VYDPIADAAYLTTLQYITGLDDFNTNTFPVRCPTGAATIWSEEIVTETTSPNATCTLSSDGTSTCVFDLFTCNCVSKPTPSCVCDEATIEVTDEFEASLASDVTGIQTQCACAIA